MSLQVRPHGEYHVPSNLLQPQAQVLAGYGDTLRDMPIPSSRRRRTGHRNYADVTVAAVGLVGFAVLAFAVDMTSAAVVFSLYASMIAVGVVAWDCAVVVRVRRRMTHVWRDRQHRRAWHTDPFGVSPLDHTMIPFHLTDTDVKALKDCGIDLETASGRSRLHHWHRVVGMSVAEVIEWHPVLRDPLNVRQFIDHSVPSGMVNAIIEADFDRAFSPAEVLWVHESGWSLGAYLELHRSTTDGDHLRHEALTWLKFMDVEMASAYLCAGVSLQEAAACHARGEDMDLAALRMMAALR